VKVGRTLYVTDRTRWRRWLARNHRTADEIWLVFYRKDSGRPRIPYNDAVEEALCYGWIDSIVKRLDDQRFAQRFSPRRPGSQLSATNRERISRLQAAGKMMRAGWAAVGISPQTTCAGLPAVGRSAKTAARGRGPTLAPDIRAALQADPAVWRSFQRFPASYRRIRVGWIEGARRRPAEFRKRLRYFVEMTRENKRFGMVQ
jgi:uncharacterized protein YdeI (YjbR/CyaY-like superfamily)